MDRQSGQKQMTMFLLALVTAAGMTFLLKEPGFSDSRWMCFSCCFLPSDYG